MAPPDFKWHPEQHLFDESKQAVVVLRHALFYKLYMNRIDERWLEPLETHAETAVERFVASTRRLANFLNKDGIPSVPFADPSVPVFSALSDIEKRHALWRVKSMNSLCEQVQGKGDYVNRCAITTRAFLEQSGFTSSPDLFQQFEEDDCVDIFNSSHQLIFASLRTFGLVSFTLETFFSRPWMELLSRDHYGVHEKLYQLSIDILAGKHTNTVSTTFVTDHICREINSIEKRSFIVFPRFFAPVFEGDQVVGYLCTNKIFPYDEPKQTY
jgi:hypothetical protein